ncbi:hypothetical protein D2917_31970 (plasmid) [Cupriavidus oxalaticus]|uniref:Uncharacterized protein n=1 Tax=Cupriavidus oxalaticus TaxID=96344 RepID=A0A5P3VR83_9BURK|nr:hypothetical protein D2917_31970 [Cupriavidus oxalaticus]
MGELLAFRILRIVVINPMRSQCVNDARGEHRAPFASLAEECQLDAVLYRHCLEMTAQRVRTSSGRAPLQYH